MFLNYSNHPSAKWSDEQLAAAMKYGDVVDMTFVSVPAEMSEEEIERLADVETERILEKKPDVVMCQGEFNLTYAMVSRLKAQDISVVAACSERVTTERTNSDGTTEKITIFKFIKFRKY